MEYIVYLGETIRGAGHPVPVVARASVRRRGEPPSEWASTHAYRTMEIEAENDDAAFRRLESIASAQFSAAKRKVLPQ